MLASLLSSVLRSFAVLGGVLSVTVTAATPLTAKPPAPPSTAVSSA